MINIVVEWPGLTTLNMELPGAGYREFVSCYVFKGERYALIDCGPRSMIPELLEALKKINANPVDFAYIFLSHIHLDHAGGVGTLLKSMPNAKVVVHERGRQHLIDPTRLWEASLKTLGEIPRLYGELEPVPEDKILNASDDLKLDLGAGVELEVLLTPGHASHHLSVWDKKESMVYAGEAAGINVDDEFTRPNCPPPFRFEDGIESIDKLLSLNPETLCYSHFGCYDNAVMRLWSAREQLAKWYNLVKEATGAGKTPEEILPMLREKDKNLSFTDRVKGERYEREKLQLINTIKGMAGSAAKAKS
jgi:glyoxylase-like metal-dependent hydrolase (beta-lactamase superfamily II)